MGAVLYVVLVLLLPATIGYLLPRWTGPALVAGLWALSLAVAAPAGGLEDSELTPAAVLVLSVAFVLVPAEVAALLGLLARRRLRPP